MGSYGCANSTAGPIAANDVGCPDLPLLSLLIDDDSLDAIFMLVQCVQRPTEAKLTRLQAGDGFP
jgi:hypothetical protein